mmetsp:Transcript_15944/g.29194  ORF Transcript_15944/g.29194 Transcript_15944/m.29194 type:complete len:269 (+) Transcript_15944:126-932(+)
MVSIQPFRSFFYQSAYLCSLLSCFTKNELVIRFLQLVGTILFMFEGIFSIDIGVDLVCGTFVMCCFTLTYIIQILIRTCPKRFDNHFEKLYTHVFADVLSRAEFYLLLKYKAIKVKEVRASGTQLQLAGNNFNSLVILGDCSNSNLALTVGPIREPDDVLVKTLKSWAWIGCIEYMEHLENPGKTTFLKTTCVLTQTEDPFIYYKVSINRLRRVFNDKRSGISVQNAFYMRMLEYLGERLYVHDERYIRAKSIINKRTKPTSKQPSAD